MHSQRERTITHKMRFGEETIASGSPHLQSFAPSVSPYNHLECYQEMEPMLSWPFSSPRRN
jgi:hypothetical protein